MINQLFHSSFAKQAAQPQVLLQGVPMTAAAAAAAMQKAQLQQVAVSSAGLSTLQLDGNKSDTTTQATQVRESVSEWVSERVGWFGGMVGGGGWVGVEVHDWKDEKKIHMNLIGWYSMMNSGAVSEVDYTYILLLNINDPI